MVFVPRATGFAMLLGRFGNTPKGTSLRQWAPLDALRFPLP